MVKRSLASRQIEVLSQPLPILVCPFLMHDEGHSCLTLTFVNVPLALIEFLLGISVTEAYSAYSARGFMLYSIYI